MGLGTLRERIDAADARLLGALAGRMHVVSEIGDFKRKNGTAFRQPAREKAVLRQRLGAAKRLGLDARFVRKLFKGIFAEALRIQRKG